MSKVSKIVYLFVTVIFFVIFDLYFSELILSSLRYKIAENPLFDLVYVQNTGAAFSILENYRIFLIIFSVAAIITVLFYAVKHAAKYSAIAGFWAAMFIAGIGCNLFERISYGYVRDFFKINFVNFPVFNISDIFINISVLAIIVIVVKNKYLRSK